MSRIVSVFGSARAQKDSPEYKQAYQLGIELAAVGFAVCNGGYGGTMEASARGAKDAGGSTVGVTCLAFHGRTANSWIDENIPTNSLMERLQKLVTLGDAYVVLKGGTGTLLELAAVWEMMNKSLIAPKPLIVLGDFWNDVVKTVRDELRDEGVMQAGELVMRAETPQQCAALLRQILENEERKS